MRLARFGARVRVYLGQAGFCSIGVPNVSLRIDRDAACFATERDRKARFGRSRRVEALVRRARDVEGAGRTGRVVDGNLAVGEKVEAKADGAGSRQPTERRGGTGEVEPT